MATSYLLEGISWVKACKYNFAGLRQWAVYHFWKNRWSCPGRLERFHSGTKATVCIIKNCRKQTYFYRWHYWHNCYMLIQKPAFAYALPDHGYLYLSSYDRSHSGSCILCYGLRSRIALYIKIKTILKINFKFNWCYPAFIVTRGNFALSESSSPYGCIIHGIELRLQIRNALLKKKYDKVWKLDAVHANIHTSYHFIPLYKRAVSVQRLWYTRFRAVVFYLKCTGSLGEWLIRQEGFLYYELSM